MKSNSPKVIASDIICCAPTHNINTVEELWIIFSAPLLLVHTALLELLLIDF